MQIIAECPLFLMKTILRMEGKEVEKTIKTITFSYFVKF